jgi:hypothetical protein
MLPHGRILALGGLVRGLKGGRATYASTAVHEHEPVGAFDCVDKSHHGRITRGAAVADR